MSVVTIRLEGLLPLKRQMQLLAMPNSKRRRLLFRVTEKVIGNSKEHVCDLHGLNGRPSEKHHRKSRRKMLSGLAKKLKVIRNNGQMAEIGFNHPATARIAVEHHRGATTRVNASDLSTQSRSRSAPATRRQAKSLREAGFKIKSANSKCKKSPTLQWVTENMTLGQAGSALRYLRDQAGIQTKSNWVTKLPARSFLGATATEISQSIEKIFYRHKTRGQTCH